MQDPLIKRLQDRCFSVNFAEQFFTEHLWPAASLLNEKVAEVKPIHKNESIEDWPISLLNSLSKFYERFLHESFWYLLIHFYQISIGNLTRTNYARNVNKVLTLALYVAVLFIYTFIFKCQCSINTSVRRNSLVENH